MSHVVHYGSSVFEGIRFYETPAGPSIFRLDDHIRRFFDSARIYRMVPQPTLPEVVAACRTVVRENRISSGYLRPLILRGVGARGLDPAPSPVETYVIAWPWGQYLGAEALERGVDVCCSSWARPAPNTFPVLSKAGGTYLNSQLMKMEAIANGYHEAIGLGTDGLVSEGSGQNLFLVRNGTLLTPTIDGTLLNGITRDTVLHLAEELGIVVREQLIPREMLYVADEIFMTGTASEVSPVRSVDRIDVGSGKVGPVCRALQTAYMDLVEGRSPDPHGWRDVVTSTLPAASQ